MHCAPAAGDRRSVASVTTALVIAAGAGACATGAVQDKLAFQGTVVDQLEHANGGQRMTPVPMPGGGSILVPVGAPRSYRLTVRGDDGRMRDVLTFRKTDNGSCIAVFVSAVMPITLSRYDLHEATVKPSSGCATPG